MSSKELQTREDKIAAQNKRLDEEGSVPFVKAAGCYRTSGTRTAVCMFDGTVSSCTVNPEKTKYMLVSRCQKAGQRQSIKMGIGPLKAWQSSNICEQHLQIKILFMKRLRAD
jgi:hypothetical protein